MGLLAVVSLLIAGCGGGSDNGSNAGAGTAGAYLVDRSTSAELPAATIDPSSPLAVATAGALMQEMAEQAEDAVDDVDELLRAATRTCGNGGSLTVTPGTTPQGWRTRLLTYANCREDDDLLEGEIFLACGSANCTDQGSIRYGSAAGAFMKQPLEGDADDVTLLWSGQIDYAGWNAGLDTDALVINLRQHVATAAGPAGTVALEAFRYEATAQGGNWARQYSGRMASTAFNLPLGGCSAPGSTVWSTSAPLVGDGNDDDRAASGRLVAAAEVPATLTWGAGYRVDAVASSGAVASYSHSVFEDLCDL
jgi:hypothetical protein